MLFYLKSASTEFLTKSSENSSSNSQKQDPVSSAATTTANYSSTTPNHRVDLVEPPPIQPYSGVLSKSLFSVIVKPQPVKPIVEFKKNGCALKSPIPTSLMSKFDDANYWQTSSSMAQPKHHHYHHHHHHHHHRNSDVSNARLATSSSRKNEISSDAAFNSRLLDKKKCISINNLLYDSSNSSSDDHHLQLSTASNSYKVAASSNNNPNYSVPNSARSVTFLGPATRLADQPQPPPPPQAMVESLSDDDSVDIDDLDDDNYNFENGGANGDNQCIDVIIGTSAANSNNNTSNDVVTTMTTSSQLQSKCSGVAKEATPTLNNSEKQRIAELEDVVKKLSSELGGLKDKLKQEAEKVKTGFKIFNNYL